LFTQVCAPLCSHMCGLPVYLALIGSHLDTVDDFYHEHLGVIITFWSSVVLSLTLCYKVFWRMRHVWCLHLFTDVLRGEGILVHFDTTEPRFQGGVLDSMILSWCFIAVIMLLVGGNTVAAFAVILQYAFTMRYVLERSEWRQVERAARRKFPRSSLIHEFTRRDPLASLLGTRLKVCSSRRMPRFQWSIRGAWLS